MLSYSALYSAIKTALLTITGVKSVETEINLFNKASSYPVLFVLGKIVSTEYIAFMNATTADREADAEITVAGTLQPKITKNIEADTLALMASVEGKLNALSNVGIVSVNCTSKDYDTDVNGKMGYFECTFSIKYVYNHLLP